MSNILKMDLISAILVLRKQGWAKRRIARELKIDRQTVRRYLRECCRSPGLSPLCPKGSLDQNHPFSTPGAEPSLVQNHPFSTPGNFGAIEAQEEVSDGGPGRPSKCDPHADLIEAKLELGLTAQRIYQDLVNEVGFVGSYQAVKRFVRHCKSLDPELIHRIEVQPAEEAQVDFGTAAPIEGEQRRRRRPWIFRIVLSYSRKAYSEAVWSQNTETFIRCLENAFRSFGGVTKTLNVDNLKAAVLRADWYDPELNPKLQSFCQHYGTALIPCRPKNPAHKGKIERNIRYVKCNALKGRVFSSLAEQNQFLAQWEQTVADARIHGTTRKQVAALFAQEKPALLPLPPSLFPCFKESKRTVHRDGYAEVDKSYYGVPPEYIGRTVWARWDSRCVRIFNERWQQIQMHAKLQPGQSTRALGLGGGRGPLEENLPSGSAVPGRWASPAPVGLRGWSSNEGPSPFAR